MNNKEKILKDKKEKEDIKLERCIFCGKTIKDVRIRKMCVCFGCKSNLLAMYRDVVIEEMYDNLGDDNYKNNLVMTEMKNDLARALREFAIAEKRILLTSENNQNKKLISKLKTQIRGLEIQEKANNEEYEFLTDVLDELRSR